VRKSAEPSTRKTIQIPWRLIERYEHGRARGHFQTASFSALLVSLLETFLEPHKGDS
jgi:hypothetical protein